MLHKTAGSILRANYPNYRVTFACVSTDMIAQFAKTYPRIKLSLDFSDERKGLIDDGFDVAIRMGLSAKKSTSTRKLFQVGRKLVASQSLLDQYPTPKEPMELSNWKWLELAPVRHSSKTFRKNGVKQTVNPNDYYFYCNDAQALYRLARAGAGLAIIPEFLAVKDIADGQVIDVFPDWVHEPSEVYAQCPSNAPKNGLIKLLINELSQNKLNH